jgi:hypothetical protein
VPDSLLGFVLARLDRIPSPAFLHGELAGFPASDLAALVSEGVLRRAEDAEEIMRPPRFPGGGLVVVRQTSRGLYGVAGEDEPNFVPIPLTEEDVRRYAVSLPKLVDRIRRENGIEGDGFADHGGLIALGQKAVDGLGVADVYLSLPNADERHLLVRCQRLQRPAGAQRVVVVTPRGVSLSPEGRRVVAACGGILVPLGAAAQGSLALDWRGIAPCPQVGPASEPPIDRRVFQKQGQTWSLVYEGVPKSVRHSLGMAYIRHLLQNPGAEIHAAALRSAVTGVEIAHLLGSAGQHLDPTALRSYRERVAEIDRDLADADSDHDLARKEALQADRELVLAELRRAVGLGGRRREAASGRERARTSVSHAVHAAFRAIQKEHEPLWRHLTNSVTVGEILSYRPDQPTAWAT